MHRFFSSDYLNGKKRSQKLRRYDLKKFSTRKTSKSFWFLFDLKISILEQLLSIFCLPNGLEFEGPNTMVSLCTGLWKQTWQPRPHLFNNVQFGEQNQDPEIPTFKCTTY